MENYILKLEKNDLFSLEIPKNLLRHQNVEQALNVISNLIKDYKIDVRVDKNFINCILNGYRVHYHNYEAIATMKEKTAVITFSEYSYVIKESK